MTEPLVLEPSFQGEGIFHTLNTGFLRALIKKKTHTKNVEHHTHTIWSQIALCYDSLKQTLLSKCLSFSRVSIYCLPSYLELCEPNEIGPTSTQRAGALNRKNLTNTLLYPDKGLTRY